MGGIRRWTAWLVVSLIAAFSVPAGAVRAAPVDPDTIDLLTDALEAIRAGDDAAYRDAADELSDGTHWLPDAGWDALDDRDESTLSILWLLLDAPPEETIFEAMFPVAFERDALADGFGQIDREFLDLVDADGVMVLQVFDHRGIGISPEARLVLGPLPEDLSAAPAIEVYDRVLAMMSGRLESTGLPVPSVNIPDGAFDGIGPDAGAAPTSSGPRPSTPPAAVPPSTLPITVAPPTVPSADATAPSAPPDQVADDAGGADADEGTGADEATVAPTPTATSPASGESGVDVATIVLAAIAVLGLLLALVTLRRQRQTDQLTGIAYTDGLTGLANRRRLDDDLAQRAREGERPTVVLMIDVDHFKRFNDTHGHGAGDDALRRVASIISRNVRSGDVAYRYGGEEFSVLLPGTTPHEAVDVAERIRDAIARATIDLPRGEVASVTVSIGMSSGPAATVTRLIDRADEALYQAKQDGRNRLILR